MEDAKEKDKPFPSSPEKNEVKCSAFDMEMIFHSHANKTHFHKKGCALGLILKVRLLGTRKWPISLAYSAGNSDYTDREEFEDEKRKKDVSPFSDSFSKTGQWRLRRRLQPAKTLLTYGFSSRPEVNLGHMDGSILDLRQVFIFLFSYVNYAHERFLSIE